MADISTGVRGPVWSQAHLLAPSGRTNPMGHPCPSFVPLLCFRPLCLGRNIGPTGTSGHPFGPDAVLFWAAAGAMLTTTLLLFFTGAAVESVRCGLEQGWTPKEVAATLAPVLSRLLLAARAEARATFPARLSPAAEAGSLWISEENSTACPPHSEAGDRVYLNPTVNCRPRLESIAQESWGHYVSVLTPGLRKSFLFAQYGRTGDQFSRPSANP